MELTKWYKTFREIVDQAWNELDDYNNTTK